MTCKKGIKFRRYTDEEIDFVAVCVPGRSFKEVAELFNELYSPSITEGQVKGLCSRLGLTNGRDCRFRPENTPHNAGVKGWGAGAAGKGAQATRFRKGNLPWNYVPVGSERRTTPHRRDGHYQIDVKVADPNVWMAKHVLVWEAAHGPVPPGHVIVFADQNRENCSLDNLLLLSRSELARLNQNHLAFKDADLTASGVALAKLLAQTHKRRRKPNNAAKEISA